MCVCVCVCVCVHTCVFVIHVAFVLLKLIFITITQNYMLTTKLIIIKLGVACLPGLIQLVLNLVDHE